MNYNKNMFIYNFKNLHLAHKVNNITMPKDMLNRHVHPFYEIFYLVKGYVTFNIETKVKVLKEGDLVIMPAGTFHHAEVDKKTYYERYVINFTEEHSYNFLLDKIKTEGWFAKNIKNLSYIFDNLDNYHKELTEEEFYVIAIGELNKILISALKGEKQLFSEKDELFSKIIKYIDEHIEENFTIQTLCDEFYYSKTFLNELFNKHVRCPVMKYIKQKKIAYAHELILAGEKKNVAAKRIGFKDYSTFYRQYRAIIGSQFEYTNSKKI